jgi:hypothetical protein
MEALDFEDSIWGRCNWVDDRPSEGIYGETTYVGSYAVVTGLRPEGIPGDTLYVSVMYSVGDDAVADHDMDIVAVLGGDDIRSAKGRHNRLIAQAHNMDMLDFVYG